MRVSLKVKSRDSDEDLTEPGIEIEGANKWLTIIQNAAKPTKVYTEKNQGVPTQTYQNQPTGSVKITVVGQFPNSSNLPVLTFG